MKQFFSLCIALLGAISTLCAQQERDLARVQKLDGVEVYILSEPLREYESMSNVKTGLKVESILTAGLFNESISDKISQFIRRARKDGFSFDAVIYSGGKNILTVRFKEAATAANKGMARVKRLEGVLAFVLAEPMEDYETLLVKNNGLKWKSLLTAGLINNSIEDDLTGYIKKMRSTGVNMDAIVYTGGKQAVSIKFKKY